MLCDLARGWYNIDCAVWVLCGAWCWLCFGFRLSGLLWGWCIVLLLRLGGLWCRAGVVGCEGVFMFVFLVGYDGKLSIVWMIWPLWR